MQSTSKDGDERPRRRKDEKGVIVVAYLGPWLVRPWTERYVLYRFCYKYRGATHYCSVQECVNNEHGKR